MVIKTKNVLADLREEVEKVSKELNVCINLDSRVLLLGKRVGLLDAILIIERSEQF